MEVCSMAQDSMDPLELAALDLLLFEADLPRLTRRSAVEKVPAAGFLPQVACYGIFLEPQIHSRSLLKLHKR